MNITDVTNVTQALGLVADPKLPSITDLLTAIVAEMKKLGDGGLSAGRGHSAQASLAGVLSMLKHENVLKETSAKITASNAVVDSAAAAAAAEADARAASAATARALRAAADARAAHAAAMASAAEADKPVQKTSAPAGTLGSLA